MEKIKLLVIGFFGFLGVEFAKIIPLAEITPTAFIIPEIGEGEVKNIIQIIIGVITIIQLLARRKKKNDDNE